MLALFSFALILFSLFLLRRFGLDWLRRAEPEVRSGGGPWDSSHLLLIVSVGLVFQVIAGSLVNLYAEARGIDPSQARAGVVLLSNAFWQGMLGATLLLVARDSSSGFASLGLSGMRMRAVALGLGFYLLALPGILGTGALWSLSLEGFSGEAPTQAVQELIAGARGSDLFLAAVLAIVVIPFLEELVFRGWLQGWISQRLGSLQGILISAALFAVLHGVSALLPIFVLALVLGTVRHCTDSLAPVWAIHAVHNGSQLAILFLFVDPQETPPPGLPAYLASLPL